MSRNHNGASDETTLPAHSAAEPTNNPDENDVNGDQRVATSSGTSSPSLPKTGKLTSSHTTGNLPDSTAASMPDAVGDQKTSRSSGGGGDTDGEDIPPSKRLKADEGGGDTPTSEARPPGSSSTALEPRDDANPASNKSSTSTGVDVEMGTSGGGTSVASSSNPETPVILSELPVQTPASNFAKATPTTSSATHDACKDDELQENIRTEDSNDRPEIDGVKKSDDGQVVVEEPGRIASSVPTTPIAAVERRHSTEGSTSPSDLSSSSRGGGNGDMAGADGRDGSISPYSATYHYLPEVPPAPPSTPASEAAFPWMGSTSGGEEGAEKIASIDSSTANSRFAGLVESVATPLPIYAPVQNAKLLEEQLLLSEGAVTPAPTRGKQPSIPSGGSSSFDGYHQQRQHQQEAMTPQPKAAGASRNEGSETAEGGVTHRRGHGGTTPSTTPLTDDFSEWAVGDRYKLLRILGRGSYGEVAQALDLSQGRPDAYVAIKRIQSPFDQEVDAVRLFREIHILRRLRGHECIIQLLDVVQPPSDDLDDFHDLYMVFEYVDTDLYKLIMSPQYLTTEHIQTFLYQMLTGLKYLHSSCVIHRDLKPANILLNEDCSLKICDFGLARIVESSSMMSSAQRDGDEEPGRDMRSPGNFASLKKAPLTRQLTKHVVTRWYRAPELILIQPYTSAVDIWSLGCILAELLSMQEGSVPGYEDRTPLFPGGTCYPLSGEGANIKSDERLDQLSVIFGVIGTPSPQDIAAIGKANEYIKTLGTIQPKPLESLYPAADPAALDLLKQMLKFNPRRRCTAEEALEHDFFKNVRRKEMEAEAEDALKGPEFLDAVEIDLQTLKRRTYEEVLWYRNQGTATASAEHKK